MGDVGAKCLLPFLKVGHIPQNYLTFSFNPFATLLQNFKAISSTTLKLMRLNQDYLSRMKIITFLVEILHITVIK